MSCRGKSPNARIENPLHLALGLGPIRAAGAREGAVVTEQSQQRAVVDHLAGVVILIDHRGLHPVVEQVTRHPAQRLEGQDVHAQHGVELLVVAEPAPQPAAVPQHHGEQPDHAQAIGLFVEAHLETGEVNLRLFAGRCLEAPLEATPGRRPDVAEIVAQDRHLARIAQVPYLAQKPRRRQLRKRIDPLQHVIPIRIQLRRPRGAAHRIPDRGGPGSDTCAPSCGPDQACGQSQRCSVLVFQLVNHVKLPMQYHR